MMKNLLFTTIGLLVLGTLGAVAEPAKMPATPAEFFQTEKIWTFHLTLTEEQFAAMVPSDAVDQGGGPFRGPQMEMPGQPPEQFGARVGDAFGPGQRLPSVFFRDAGKKDDESFSEQEFSTLAGKWFDTANTEKVQKLSISALQEKLAKALETEQGREPPGGGGPGKQIDFPYVQARLEFAGSTLNNIGLRYSGNNTWKASQNTIKKPFKVDTNEFVKKQKIASISSFNLRNNINDASSLQEVMAYQLYREAGVPAPRTAYARVYLTVSGKYNKQYLGLYGLVENINKTFASERYGSKAGAIFKPETRSLFAYLGDDWAKYEQSYNPKTKLTEAESNRVIAFSKLVGSSTDAEFSAQLGNYLDIDEVARYFAVTVWTAGLDSILSMGHNYYLYLDAGTNRFQILPWDLDHTFGSWMASDLENLSVSQPWQGNHRFLERLFSNDTFKKAYLGHMAEFQKTIFSPEKIARDAARIAGTIRDAVKEESPEKLAQLEKASAGKDLQNSVRASTSSGRMRGGPGGGMQGPGVVAFAKIRSQSVANQLAGKTTGSSQNDRRGPGGRRGGPGGESFAGSPERMAITSILAKKDSGKASDITRTEFTQIFSSLFKEWDTDRNGSLTKIEVQAGLQKLMPGGQQRRNGTPQGDIAGPGEGVPPPRWTSSHDDTQHIQP